MFRLISAAFASLVVLGSVLGSSGPAIAMQTADTLAASVPDGDVPDPGSVLYDPYVRREGKRGLDLLYDMQFAEAEAIFASIDRRYPAHPVGPFLQALNVWWTILLDLPDTSHDDRFLALMEEVIARSEAMLDADDDSFDATFFLGAALGFRGRLRSNRGRWIKALRDGERAIGYVREVARRAPENDDYVFGKGLYDYYVERIPIEYPSAKAIMWILPDGNMQRGLRLLERTASEGWYIQTEAAYFLSQIHYLYEDDYDETLRYALWLREAHPRNPYFHNFAGRVYFKWGRFDKARTAFAEVVARHEAGAPGYNDHQAEVAHYYLARVCMVRDAWREALYHLAAVEQFTADEDDDYDLKVLGRLRQGMVYDALGARDVAVTRYRGVLRMEDASGAHDRARRYLQTPYDG